MVSRLFVVGRATITGSCPITGPRKTKREPSRNDSLQQIRSPDVIRVATDDIQMQEPDPRYRERIWGEEREA